ncbi:phenylacetate--CoA ligase family protein [Alkalimarinus alittae]|uniref:Phenylacetate-CoA ligase n=1 Tax=Alkalimarinus alittae TaxID=2961619 RepID=A0ABY6MY76_9ALTE|nr:hypothetical protein [Alkalimarinus alittae]UZE94797.1 hypothetical protein NKI27_11985 [Alkalimarinus alittae]
MMKAYSLDADERMPDLHLEGSERLNALIDQPHAPIYRNRSGHHLQPAELDALKQFTTEEFAKKVSAKCADNDWLQQFIAHCFSEVPFYRQYVRSSYDIEAIPTINRADLSQDITGFVPDGLPTDRLITFETSGTTGHPLMIPSHPTVAAKYSAYHKKALAWNGVNTDDFKSDLAIILAGYQEKCFTYASISPYLNNKGLVKLNFHPNDWHDPDDRHQYIDNNKPDLISGDPISLGALSKIPFSHQPKAILTTSMTLLSGCKQLLNQRFGCPIIDLYSLNEIGPVGCSVLGKKGFKLLQSKLYVEILDTNDTPVAPGQRGEITVTGGFNHYLPLLRYRTGDFGRLEQEGNDWFIQDLEGRPPVQFKTSKGVWLNNVDVTHLLQAFPLTQFSLHQHVDGTLTVKVLKTANTDELIHALTQKFGYPVDVKQIEKVNSEKKIIQYTSDLRA